MKKLIKIVLLTFSAFIAIGVIASVGATSSATGTSLTTVVEDTLSWDTQAKAKAEQYLYTMPFSRSGLIEQLQFEGFDKAEATVAVDSITVDWYKQASLKAEQYLQTMPMSKSGLIEQLKFEGFTSAEATYGANSIG